MTDWLVEIWPRAAALGALLAGLTVIGILLEILVPRFHRTWASHRRQRSGRRAVRAVQADPALRAHLSGLVVAATAACGETRAWAYAIRYHGGGSQVLLAGAPGPAGAGFRATSDRLRWAAPLIPDLTAAAPEGVTLALLGAHEGTALLVDVNRAPGPIVVHGPPRVAGRFIAALQAQLPATAPAVVGPPEDGPQWTMTLDETGRLTCPALALERLETKYLSLSAGGMGDRSDSKETALEPIPGSADAAAPKSAAPKSAAPVAAAPVAAAPVTAAPVAAATESEIEAVPAETTATTSRPTVPLTELSDLDGVSSAPR